MSNQHKKQEDFDVLEQELNLHEIILFNDDVNTFEHVIESLIDVCNHTSVQAEQCAYLVHFKGKCAVKSGEYDELKPRCTRLLNLGLSAEIV
ncbi:ATP-dependent Clp protease adaptor ClpS [Aureibaculum conchae]|uniref:ATP-dependent Clp protease adaptor ClpS n=1 Tax=Aureibaculum sp. 2308TA14-22 TaxID=3108392 RepID=UPI003395AE67